MKIYDISQEVFSCAVYPGDTEPKMTAVKRTERGDLYNLTDISMCAHNGTHIDAPFHFLGDGKTVEKIELSRVVGDCYVFEFDGILSASDAEKMLKSSAARILIKGNANMNAESARVFADANIALIGIESQSVGDMNAPMEVHKILLRKEVVLLEGLRLSGVPEGEYFLCAAPLALGGADGAPCRAILIEK